MPNRNDTRGFGGPGQGEDDRDRRDREARGGPTRGPVRGDEGRAFGDPGFRAEDARLNAELNRYDRQRGRPARVEYGHDQNYRPGYHAGGSRFQTLLPISKSGIATPVRSATTVSSPPKTIGAANSAPSSISDAASTIPARTAQPASP